MNAKGELLYDLYRAAVRDPGKADAFLFGTVEGAVLGNMWRTPDIRAGWLRSWDAAKVYILTVDAMRVVIEAGERLRPGQVPIPHPPALPMWLEFDQAHIRYNDVTITGFFIEQDPDDGRICVQVCGADVPLGFWYEPDTATWTATLNQTKDNRLLPDRSRCQNTACPLRRKTPGNGIKTGSHDRVLADDGFACSCWAMYESWTRMVTAFLSLLVAQGVEREVIHDNRHASKARQRRDGVKPPPRNQVRYTRISLSHPEPHHVVRRDGAVAFEPVGQEDDADANYRTVVKQAHPRLLIAAPGTRWLQTRIVWVRQSQPYRLRIIRNQTRYIVEE